jgi:DNA-binding MarR family transcriptional regulator
MLRIEHFPNTISVTTSPGPTYEQSVSAIHNRLFFRIFQSANTLDRQSIKELGISPVHWAVLGALSRPQVANGMSFSDLTEYLFVSRQSLDGLLKRLEKEGQVVRVQDTTDRRVKKVTMTPAGRKIWNSLQPRIYEFYQQSMDGLRFDDKVTLLHFLNRVNEGMRNVSLKAPNSSTQAVRKSRKV